MQLLTVKQLASMLNVSPLWVYQQVAKGQLPAIRFSKRGKILFKRDKVEALINKKHIC